MVKNIARICASVAIACLVVAPVGAVAEQDEVQTSRKASDIENQRNADKNSIRQGRLEALRAGEATGGETASHGEDSPEQPLEGLGLEKRGKQSSLDAGSPGDEDTEGSFGDSEEMVLVCHKPGTRAEHSLLVPASSLSGHLGHGDTLGACPGDQTPVSNIPA